MSIHTRVTKIIMEDIMAEAGEQNQVEFALKESEANDINENDKVEEDRKLSHSSAVLPDHVYERKSSISNILLHDDRISNAYSRATDTSDMRLIVEGKPLYVSRLVLSIISPVFKDIFEKRAREMSIFEIPLPGRKYEEILEFLYCVYPDSLKPISDENLAILLKLSEEYKVQTLKNRCSQFMARLLEGKHKSVPIEKLVWFMKLAEHYQLEIFLEKAMEMASRTPCDILENNSEFYDLSPTTTTTILMGRLRLFEKANQKIQKKLSESEAHCSLYHKQDGVCKKCYVAIGKLAVSVFSQL